MQVRVFYTETAISIASFVQPDPPPLPSTRKLMMQNFRGGLRAKILSDGLLECDGENDDQG